MRDGKISGGSKETTGEPRQGQERDKGEAPALTLTSFFSNVASLFHEQIYTDERLAADIRAAVVDHLTIDDEILRRENVGEHPH